MLGGRIRGGLRRAVLGSVLFLLVLQSLSIFFFPGLAYAQQTSSQICASPGGTLVNTATIVTNFAAPYVKGDALDQNAQFHDVGTKIQVTLGGDPTTELTKTEALIYRATTTTDAWTKVGTATLTKGALNAWTGEYTGTLPNGAYRLFVLFKGYGKNTLTNQESLIAQGCSQAQTVTKGPSEVERFCDGSKLARERVGFEIKLSTVVGGRPEENRPATFEIIVQLRKGLANSSQPKISFKRSYNSQDHVLTTLQENVSLGNTTDVSTTVKAWKVQISDPPPTPNGNYRYHALGEITVNGQRYTTCHSVLHRWGKETDDDLPQDTEEYRTLFECLAKDVNRHIVTDMKVFDNEDNPPSIRFSQAPLEDCPVALPKMDFIMSAYQAFSKGDVVVSGMTIKVPALFKDVHPLGIISNLNGFWNDTNDVVRFTFIEPKYPFVVVVDTDADAKFFLRKDDGKLEGLIGDLAYKFGWAGINAKHGFYEVLGNRVFMKPGCTEPVVYPNDNGQVYSYPSNKVTDATDCLYRNADGWLAKWGAQDLESGCSVSIITDGFTQGIGTMIGKMIGCLAASLFQGVLEAIKPLLEEVGSRSLLPDTPPHPLPASTVEARATISPIQENGPKISGIASFFIGTAHAGDFESELKNPESVIVRIWKYARSLLNILVVAALLAIAFANIFHFNINTYAAKKMLPGLVIGVIAANGSLLIIRFLADVTQALSQLAVDMIGRGTTIKTLVAFEFPRAIGEAAITALIASFAVGTVGAFFTGGLSLIGWVLIMLAFVLYYLFLVIAFAFALLKRIIVLYFLTMLSPLAFVAYGIPQFQKYFYQWWEHFLRHLFLFPVILFGMSATVVLADQLGVMDYVDLTSISSVVSMILVMAAATMVLKLPKIFTKGAIDVMSTFKKAIGAAPMLTNVAGAASSGLRGLRDKKIGARIESKMALINNPDLRKLAKEGGKGSEAYTKRREALLEARALRQQRARNLERDKTVAGKYKTLTGFATLFSRPELVQDAWKARVDRENKNNYIKAMTRTHGLMGLVRGADAEAELARKLGLEESKDARTPGDLQDLAETLFEGHIKAVEKKGVKAAMEEIAKKDPALFEMLRNKSANFKSRGEVDDFIAMLNEKAGTNIQMISAKDYHDMMKFSAFQNAVTRVARGIRDTEEGIDPNLKNAIKVGLAFPGYSLASKPGGGPGSPYGGGTRESANRIAQFTDEQIQKRVEEIFNHSAVLDPSIGEEIQEKFVQNLNTLNDLEVMNPSDAGFATALEKTRDTLLEAVGASSGAEADALREAIRQTNDPAVLTKLTENLSIAAAARSQGDTTKESIASIVAQASQGTQGFHQAHGQLINNTDLSRLEQSIAASLQSGGQDLAEVLSRELGTGIDKMSDALGKKLNPDEQRKLFQQMAAQISGSMIGPGPRSLRTIIQGSISSLPKTFAKAVGVHTLQARAMDAQIPQPSSPPNPPTP